MTQSRFIVLRRWIGVVASILGLAGLSWYIAQYASEFYRLRALSGDNIALLSGLVLFTRFFIALKLQLMIRTFNVKSSLLEVVLLNESAGFLNIIPFNLGTGFRAVYLKTVHRLKFIDFSLGFLSALLTELIAAGFLGLFFSLQFPDTSYLLRIMFLAYILIPMLLVAVAWLVRRSDFYQQVYRNYILPKGRGKSWYDQLLYSLVSSLETMIDQPRMVYYRFLLNLVTNFLYGIRYWLVGMWLGYSVNFAAGMVLQSAARAAAAVIILPAGTVGLRETMTGLGASGLGASAVSGVMVSTIDRIVTTIWIVLVGGIGLIVLSRRISHTRFTPSVGDVSPLIEPNSSFPAGVGIEGEESY